MISACYPSTIVSLVCRFEGIVGLSIIPIETDNKVRSCSTSISHRHSLGLLLGRLIVIFLIFLIIIVLIVVTVVPFALFLVIVVTRSEIIVLLRVVLWVLLYLNISLSTTPESDLIHG